jgi:fibronectin-binding autotransporter adhesin
MTKTKSLFASCCVVALAAPSISSPLLAQTATLPAFSRVQNDGTVQTGQGISALSLDGDGASGFELQVGSVTVDGQGQTFTGYNSQGSEGAGGGGGLGGVFFVNEGATLTIENASFEGNTAAGGAGGGGGSNGVRDVNLELSTKTVPGTPSFIIDYESNVIGNGGSFYLKSLQYGDSPPYSDPLQAATYREFSINPNATTPSSTVDSVNNLGVVFSGNGIDVSGRVQTALLTATTNCGLLNVTCSGLQLATFDPSDVDANQLITKFNMQYVSGSMANSLAPGVELIQTGSGSKVKIVSVTRDAAGKVTEVIVDTPISPAAISTYTPPMLVGAHFTRNANGTSLNYGAGNAPDGFEVGMTLTGDDIPSGSIVKIETINDTTGVVTLFQGVNYAPLPSGALSFDASKPASEVNNDTIFAPTPNSGLEVGDVVTGTGILAGTTVSSVNGDEITLSHPNGPGTAVTATVTEINVKKITVRPELSGSSIGVTSGVGQFKAGQIVTGDGIPAGTTVISVDTNDNRIYVDQNVAVAPSKIEIVSDTSFGGGMNGRVITNLPLSSQAGQKGLSPSINSGEGGSGQNGNSNSPNSNGTGGVGGSGGDGQNGWAIDPDQILAATSVALDIAGTSFSATALAVPDPYPKPVAAGAGALEIAKLVVDAATIAKDIAARTAQLAFGLTGTGGNGGNGGDGGDGSVFFGGGTGGAGGVNGKAVNGGGTGDGTPGAGGTGGGGGFGGGGGSGGQPGAGAPFSNNGAGGTGGFGGGTGSTVNADGSTRFGAGGSGFGGAIFVRTGGTLVLSGEMTFDGNSVVAGSSRDDNNGEAGFYGGSDLFIMKDANVTLSADASQSIIFNGSIGDDSKSTYDHAQYAAGDGAAITIAGEGQVEFNGENTLSGDTILVAGTLKAQDGTGINADSRIVFDGILSTALTDLKVPVLLSSGEFTRWAGSASDNVMWSGSGGFAATEDGLTVELGKSISGNQKLQFGPNGFAPDGFSLVLGSIGATGVVTFVNDMEQAAAPHNNIDFYLVDNPNSVADYSVLKGDVDAEFMAVRANSGIALMQVESTLKVVTLNILGGTVETKGTGNIADTGAIDIASGATFIAGTVDTVGAVTSTGTYDVNAAQTVASLTNNLGGLVEQSANITSAGNVTQNGTLDVDGARRIETTGATAGLTGSGAINVTGAADALTMDQLGNTTFAGTITGAGSFTKEGTGTLTVTGASTFTGGTTVSEGALDTTGGGTLADTGAIDIASGATFIAGTVDTVGAVTSTGTYDVNAAQTVASLTNNLGGLVEQSANITSTGNVIQNGTLDVDGARRIETTGATAGLTGSGAINVTGAADALTMDQLGSTTFAGTITGAGSFTKEGMGTVEFSGPANSIQVTDLTSTGGGLTLTNGGVLNSNTDLKLNNSTFTINAGAQTLASVSGDGSMDLNGSDLMLTGASDFDGPITNAGTLALRSTFDYDGTLTGDVLDLEGATFVVKPGSGAEFRAVNISNSDLTVNGPPAAAGLKVTGAITVTGNSTLTAQESLAQSTIKAQSISVSGAGASLQGIAYIDVEQLTISNGATIAPGASPGPLTVAGDFDMSLGGVAQMEIGGPSPATVPPTVPGTAGYDQITIGGVFKLGGTSTLRIDPFGGFASTFGQTFNLFEFDADKKVDSFANFTNSTAMHYVYSEMTGELTSLGSNAFPIGQQLAQVSTVAPGQNGTQISSVVNQLANPATATNGIISAGGGSLIGSLAAAAPGDRLAIFSRFTPEGYGGVFEYAYRSLQHNSNMFERIDTINPQSNNWVTLTYDNHAMKTDRSLTLSDYQLAFRATGLQFGTVGDLVALGFGFQKVNGNANVEQVSSSSGTGEQYQIAASYSMFEGERSKLEPYFEFEIGTHTMSGSRTALTSTTQFTDVVSKAQTLTLGARYDNNLRGGSTFNINASLMAGSVDAMNLSETGGHLADRLTVSTPSMATVGASLTAKYQSDLSDRLSFRSEFNISQTSGLEDYTMTSRVGTDPSTFTSTVPGFKRPYGSLSIGGTLRLGNDVFVGADAHLDDLFNTTSSAGASFFLKRSF